MGDIIRALLSVAVFIIVAAVVLIIRSGGDQ
jgi:hypothetical protein